MKIVILTTETAHHTYFTREIIKVFQVEKVLVEFKGNNPSFETFHPYEKLRDDYEKEVFFNGKDVCLEDICPVIKVDSVNNSNSLTYLQEAKPEIIVVFGTKKICSDLIQVCPEGIVNLHGGNPQEYRCLDSHLWAIYHEDFDNLITTLHRVNEELDDGDIISQGVIEMKSDVQLHELRRYNTENCIELTLSAVDMYKKHKKFISKPQRKRGQYYSFMPSSLKEICINRFTRYINNI